MQNNQLSNESDQNLTQQKPQSTLSPQLFTKGNVTFIPEFTEYKMLTIIPQSIINQLDKSIWIMFMNTNIQFPNIFKYIHSTTIQKLCISRSTFNDSLMTQVISIKFLQLQVLSLCYCNLTTIEGLCFVDAPYLKEILLAGNNIVHAEKAVNKLMFSQLKRIQLSQNHVKKLRVERCQASTGTIYLTLFNYQGSILVEDISIFAPFPFRFTISASQFKFYCDKSSLQQGNTNSHIMQQRVAKAILAKKAL